MTSPTIPVTVKKIATEKQIEAPARSRAQPGQPGQPDVRQVRKNQKNECVQDANAQVSRLKYGNVGEKSGVKALAKQKLNEVDQRDMFPGTLPKYKFVERDQMDMFPQKLTV